MADIILLYKSMYTTIFSSNVSELVKIYITNTRFRSNRKGLLLQSQLRTGTYKRFYTNRIVTLRNQLPPALRVHRSFIIFLMS